MTTKETSYLLKEEYIIDNRYQELATKLLNENFKLLLESIIKETNQEVIKEKKEKNLKLTKQNPQSIIQEKAEIYILKEDIIEEAFNIKGISKLIKFGRYSGNSDDVYTYQTKAHNGTGDDPAQFVAEFVVNFNKQVFAFKGDIHDQADIIQTLKDQTSFPVLLNQAYDATRWHAIAIVSAFKNGFATDIVTALAATVIQVGFRELFNEQFITEAVQETYQQQFLKYKFMPNWNDKNSYDKYHQKFEELRVLANYQYAAVFKLGPYTDYKLRLLPEMKERLTFQSGLGAITTEADFWQQTATIFYSIRQNKVTLEKAQQETLTKKFKKINNIDTNRRNDKRNDNCFNCNQPGHYTRNCPLQRKKESFNRIETQRITKENLFKKQNTVEFVEMQDHTIQKTVNEITNTTTIENLQKDQHL
ncbi:hypothetical protein F8M41_008536 [Gigaspora margarita]|uniref:CCHC-type domain-containing protein n=1 Tax=Gigaspora margarita TaxID=4874 RepID=A0A8H4B4I8_GIGMA|nr:hypothetical protein F8M41_008536 [Gigaspora margarita]